LGEHVSGGAEEQARGSEILCGPMEQGLACSAGYSFSMSLCGEAFHELEVQSADISALAGALLQPSVSPASQQSTWITELLQSAALSQ
jgi:hypothetical protein